MLQIGVAAGRNLAIFYVFIILHPTAHLQLLWTHLLKVKKYKPSVLNPLGSKPSMSDRAKHLRLKTGMKFRNKNYIEHMYDLF